MRSVSLVALAIGMAALTACDEATSPRRASVGTTAASAGSRAALVITPSRVQLTIGGTSPLATNAPADLLSDVQWSSLQPSIASVSSSGVVTALGAGTATIRARYASDTTNQATSTVDVVAPGAAR